MPGSPFSPWNRGVGKEGQFRKSRPRAPPLPQPCSEPPLAPTRQTRTQSHEWGLWQVQGKDQRGVCPKFPGTAPLPPSGHPVTLDGPAPHLGSREALLASGAQVSLRPGWSLQETQSAAQKAPASGTPPRPRRPPDTPVRMGAPAPVPRPHGGPPGLLPAKQRPRARWGGTHGEACEPHPALWRERQQRSGPAAGRCTAPSPSRGRTYLRARHARQRSLCTSQQSQGPGEGRKRTTFTMNTQLP